MLDVTTHPARESLPSKKRRNSLFSGLDNHCLSVVYEHSLEEVQEREEEDVGTKTEEDGEEE